MKKVEQLKAGMEIYVKFNLYDNDNDPYTFKAVNKSFTLGFTQDCRLFEHEPPLEMFTIDENEIPELKGVEMEVSDNGIDWHENLVYGKTKHSYFANDGNYLFARPIQKTFDLSNVPEHLLTDELKQYLK